MYNWMKDEEFREKLARARGELEEFTKVELKSLMLESIPLLRDLMKDPDPHVRLRAIRTALSLGFKVNDLERVERRLEIMDDAMPLWAKSRNSWPNRS